MSASGWRCPSPEERRGRGGRPSAEVPADSASSRGVGSLPSPRWGSGECLRDRFPGACLRLFEALRGGGQGEVGNSKTLPQLDLQPGKERRPEELTLSGGQLIRENEAPFRSPVDLDGLPFGIDPAAEVPGDSPADPSVAGRGQAARGDPQGP
jgi:hypothetical protein